MNQQIPPESITFSTSKEAFSAMMQIVQEAKYQLEIFSHHLDPKLFDRQELCDQLSRVARSGRRAQIHILVQDTNFLCDNDHRLLHLQRRLNSYIQLKHVHKDYRDMNQNFVITDQQGLVYLEQANRYEGMCEAYAPAKARELRQLFEQIWQRSEVDTRLRQLF